MEPSHAADLASATIWNKSDNAVTRDILGETIIVPIAGDIVDMQALFTVDGVGAFLWDHLDGSRDTSQLCSLLISEYDVARETAEDDLHAFLQELLQAGLIEKKQ